jgi:hypothetical protein
LIDCRVTGYFNKFGSWSYFDRMESELAMMAARGLTVFAGSGDAGATNVGEAGNVRWCLFVFVVLMVVLLDV